MKRYYLLLLASALLFIGSASKSDKLELDTTGLDKYDVVEVIDGDTIKVDYNGTIESVRIIGVDTPETKHPSKPVEYYGKEASAFTAGLLDGVKVYLEPDQGKQLERDKYGRLLAHVWRASDKLLIAERIIHDGYGFFYGTYPFRQSYMDAYRTAEKDAREHDRGLWAPHAEASASSGASGSGSSPSVGTGQSDNSSGDVTVYITDTGEKYHRGNCRYLKKSKHAISLADAKAAGYTPCSVCDPPR
jgi:micrococcal nuclease